MLLRRALQVLIDPWQLIPLLLGPPSADMGPSLNLTVGALLLGVLFTAVCVNILYLADIFPQIARRSECPHLQRLRHYHHADVPISDTLPKGP